MPQSAVFDRMDRHRNPEKQKMKKIKSVNIISLANFMAITTVLAYLTFTILMVVFGGLLGGIMGGGGDAMGAAGGGLVAGLIGVVIAAPISWIIGVIYGLFMNIALKAIGGLSIEIEG
ncbi:MAG: hypothetical protein NZ936_12585 [Alphaproteobacteria bacterium]|nr:hypothetical protein [Alphaproteobacteria bacterium]